MKTLLASLPLLLLAAAAFAEPPVPWGQAMNAADWYRVQFSGGKCYYPKAAFDAADEGAALTLYTLTLDQKVGDVAVWKADKCQLTGITKMSGTFNNPGGPGGMEMVKGAPASGGLMIAAAPGADVSRIYKSLAYFNKAK